MNKVVKYRLIRTVILSALAFIVGGGLAYYQIKHIDKGAGASTAIKSGVAGAAIGGPYTLSDNTGRIVTDKEYADKYKLIYFGFTFCPAICPTELQRISRVMDAVGDVAESIQPLFITVDPERDTVDVMQSYVSLFHPKLVGLTGTRVQIDDVLKAYRVYAKQVWEEGANDYTMDHSSYIYLMDPDDNLLSIYRIADEIDYIVKDVVAKIPRR